MKYGVIDIGSNTMRTVIYNVTDTSFNEVVNEKEFAEILSYVEDDALTDDGIERLCGILKRMKMLCDETQCEEAFCFATASLRGINNQKEVIQTVKAETGVTIQLLSGCDESYLDFIGLHEAIDASEALGFDLGGGSAQIFYYNNDTLLKSCSNPIGTLAMYNKHVKGLFPNSKERSKIAKTVKKHLEACGDYRSYGQKVIYGMGGTARACAKVHKHLLGRDDAVQEYRITLDELEEIDTMLTGLGLSGIKILNRIIPERLVTFIPGLITIKIIMRHVGVEELVIVEYGVREGYLVENAIHKGRGMNGFRKSNGGVCQ